MLKDIDPLLTADLLYALRAMGHGDELVLADGNFPAETIAADTTFGTPIALAGASVVDAARAVLTVLPLDEGAEGPVWRMEVVGGPSSRPPVQAEMQAVVEASLGRSLPLSGLERHAFYARARQAFAVVSTTDQRSYGDFILKKGVISSN